MQRDTRLDLLRGWLQLTIFASHAFGSCIGAWLIHGAWGLSDSSEQFVFLSGLTLGSVFDHKLQRYGWRTAARDMWLRAARLYRTHLLVLCGFALLVLALRAIAALAEQIAVLRWSYWFAHPMVGSLGAVGLLYQPAFLDILPIFILSMLALPGFAWLLARVGWAALLAPLSLYAGAALLGWELPRLGDAPTGFNVLSWQVLFMLGAWIGTQTRRGEWHLPARRVAVGIAALVVVAGVAWRIGEHGLLPWHLPHELAGWSDKRGLAPLRIVHALSLALLAVSLLPRDARWMHWRVSAALAAMGRHSLRVFCLGLFLSWACAQALRLLPYSVGLDALLISGGFVLLAGWAAAIERWRGRISVLLTRPKRTPPVIAVTEPRWQPYR